VAAGARKFYSAFRPLTEGLCDPQIMFSIAGSQLAGSLVEERKNKLKQFLGMQGLSKQVYWGSWMLFSFLKTAITVLVMLVVVSVFAIRQTQW